MLLLGSSSPYNKLVDLLKGLMVQYWSSKTINHDSNLQNPVQARGQMIADETPERMEDLAKIKSSKTNKTVLKPHWNCIGS